MKQVILGFMVLVAMPAAASATDRSINLTANVPKFCKFDAVPTFNNFDNITLVSSSVSSSVLNVTQATNPLGIMNEAGFTFKVQATCNYPSTVLLTTLNGGLKDGSPEAVFSGTFLKRIDYNTIATWNGAPVATLTTNGSANATSAPRNAGVAHTGDLTAYVNFLTNTSAPLAAGDYTDTLRISLTPQ